jgi:hypothetical protein
MEFFTADIVGVILEFIPYSGSDWLNIRLTCKKWLHSSKNVHKPSKYPKVLINIVKKYRNTDICDLSERDHIKLYGNLRTPFHGMPVSQTEMRVPLENLIRNNKDLDLEILMCTVPFIIRRDHHQLLEAYFDSGYINKIIHVDGMSNIYEPFFMESTIRDCIFGNKKGCLEVIFKREYVRVISQGKDFALTERTKFAFAAACFETDYKIAIFLLKNIDKILITEDDIHVGCKVKEREEVLLIDALNIHDKSVIYSNDTTQLYTRKEIDLGLRILIDKEDEIPLSCVLNECKESEALKYVMTEFGTEYLDSVSGVKSQIKHFITLLPHVGQITENEVLKHMKKYSREIQDNYFSCLANLPNLILKPGIHPFFHHCGSPIIHHCLILGLESLFLSLSVDKRFNVFGDMSLLELAFYEKRIRIFNAIIDNTLIMKEPEFKRCVESDLSPFGFAIRKRLGVLGLY